MSDTDLIRRGDAIAAIPNGWLWQPHCSNMDYGPNVSVQAIASIRALPAQEPPSSGVTAGATGAGVDIAVITKLRNCLINSLSANGKRVSLDREQTRGLMLVAADRLEAAIARTAELENALDERGKELTAAWHQLGAADLGPLAKAAQGMKHIVEEIDGAMNHGTWRDEKGVRLKDTPEWVALYNAISNHPATPAPVVPADQRAAIEALADRMWRVHPKDIHAAGYEHLERGGKYENPRAAWYADQIEALFKQFRDQVSPVVPAEGLERALLAHHEWHQRLGVIVFPPEDDQDGPTEIDMSAEYADSRLHEQTVAALSGASIVQSVDDHAHAALSHALQYLRGEAPNVMSGGHRNGQLRSMIKWVLLGCGGPLRSAPPVGARVIAEKAYLAGFNAAGEGYNGEWPFHDKGISPDTDEGWLIGRDMALAALLPAGEGE